MKCSEVLQCSGSTSNKVLTLLKDIQTTGRCCLYVFCYYHILSVAFLFIYGCIPVFNTVIYVFYC